MVEVVHMIRKKRVEVEGTIVHKKQGQGQSTKKAEVESKNFHRLVEVVRTIHSSWAVHRFGHKRKVEVGHRKLVEDMTIHRKMVEVVHMIRKK